MEQCVLAPACVCNNNRSLNTQAVTKQELPKYQAEQNPKYQIASLKKERNKKLFPKAHSLGDRKMYCPRIKLSNLQTIILDGVKTGVLLSTFAQELCRKKADVKEIYFTLLQVTGISPILVLNQNSKTKETSSWIPLKM